MTMTESEYVKASDEELATEAERWASRDLEPSEWMDAPEAVPRQGAATPISIRIPTRMLKIMKAFAKREGIGYQVLMKQWLDDRINEERAKLSESTGAERERPVLVTNETETQ